MHDILLLILTYLKQQHGITFTADVTQITLV